MAKRFFVQRFFSPIFVIFSWIYAFIMWMRAFLYRRGIFSSYMASLPTFCVGNISWGGTGKSPITDYILQRAKENNVSCAVLTRGYGFKGEQYPLVLHSENCDEGRYPDEALMLMQSHPETTIFIDPNRVRAVQYIEEQFTKSVKGSQKKVDCILLDDGFQHLRLRRDYDIVLLDKDDLYPQDFIGMFTEKNRNWNRLIPLGSWREPPSALRRASVFLLKCPPEEWKNLRPLAVNRLNTYQKMLFVFHMQATGIVHVFKNIDKPFASPKNYAILLGVANPKQVEETLTAFLGFSPQKQLYYSDHHDFTGNVSDIAEILKTMPIICTEKDAVKLEKFSALAKASHSIYKLQSRVVFHDSAFTLPSQNFDGWMQEQWAKNRC